MTVYIDYAMVSPAVVDVEISRACPKAYTRFLDCEDFFLLRVCSYDGEFTPKELAIIERVLAPYV